MNGIIIESTIKTLNKTNYILSLLNDELLGNTTIPPYMSSIGSHVRHILDFYDCILNITPDYKVDLTSRKRDLMVETKCSSAFTYYNDIVNRIKSNNYNLDLPINVLDDLGLGKVEIPYTYGSLLAQANSHTIHHYAIINYILQGLNITIDDSVFGYNPTTPKEISSN